jgi:hypothetical protein
VPCFLVPLFREHPSNHLLVQRITKSDTIEAFDEFDNSDHYEQVNDQRLARSASIGDKAIWAFSDSSGKILLGTADEIKTNLEHELSGGELADFPLLRSEVAAFCGALDERRKALVAVYKSLGGPSGLGAAVWLDEVILCPVACSDLYHQALKNGIDIKVSDLGGVFVRSNGKFAEVYLSATVFKALREPSSRSLPSANELASAFGLKTKIKIEADYLGMRPLRRQSPAAPLDYPLALFGGRDLSGRSFHQSFISPAYPKITIGPFGPTKVRDGHEGRPAYCGEFVVFRNSADEINVEFSEQKELTSCNSVGIIVQRVGFGSVRRSTVGVASLVSRPGPAPGRFANLFYIGGHVLQRSLSKAPELDARAHGYRLALSCASAVMALAYSTGAKSLQHALPWTGRKTISLALRHVLKRDETLGEVLRTLLGLLHHPEVRLEDCSTLFLVVSRSLSMAKNELTNELLSATQLKDRQIRFLDHPARGENPQISLVAEGIPFRRPTLSTFGQFCRDLLLAIGWQVETKPSERTIVASRNGLMISFTPFLLPGYVAAAAEVAMGDAFAGSIHCLLTDFTPNNSAKQVAQAHECSIIHYSRINEWFYSEILNPTSRPA